jgi:SAM-dependent methyltransferase
MNLRLKNKIKNLTPPFLRDPLINIIFQTRTIFYMGNNVTCPCCGENFSKFYPGSSYGNCPLCGSAARHRSVMLCLINRTDFFQKKLKVLHFAPEFCFNRIFTKLPNLEYISADISSARAKEKIDMTSIEYRDNTFDVVLSLHVLEHIDDDRKALKELYRVLKPGGWCILQVPMDYSRDKTFENPQAKSPKEREKSFGHFDHRRIYGRDYVMRLREAGFEVIIIKTKEEYNREQTKRYGLKDYEEIYICNKQ